MTRIRVLSFAVALACAATPGVATAQAVPSPADEARTGARRPHTFDVRLGGISLPGQGPDFSGGGSLTFHPWSSGASRRLTIETAFDYSRLRATEQAPIPCIDVPAWADCRPGLDGVVVRAETVTHWTALSGSLGFDLIQTRRLVVDVRGGAALIGNHETFGVWRDVQDWGDLSGAQRAGDALLTGLALLTGTTRDIESDGFRSLCYANGAPTLDDRCTDRYRMASLLGFSVTVWHPSEQVGFGIDYSRLGRDERQIVGTVRIGFGR